MAIDTIELIIQPLVEPIIVPLTEAVETVYILGELFSSLEISNALEVVEESAQ